jgi:hypothetical protein
LARLDKLKLIPQIAGVCSCITVPPYSLQAATISCRSSGQQTTDTKRMFSALIQKLNAES